MAVDDLVRAARSHRFNHAGVVQFIREYGHIWQLGAKRAQPGQITHVAAGKNQTSLFVVQARQFSFQLNMQNIGAANVAGTAHTSALRIDGCLHRLRHFRMLAHRKVIV